jgi:hypothetical protein
MRGQLLRDGGSVLRNGGSVLTNLDAALIHEVVRVAAHLNVVPHSSTFIYCVL